MAVITISRLDASRGDEVAARLASRLGFRLIDRKLMKELLYSFDLLSSLGRIGGSRSGEGEEEKQFRETSEGILMHLAFRENVVILGHGGQFLFRGWPGSLHVRLTASMEYRLRNFTPAGRGQPEAVLNRRERERRRLVRKYFGQDLTRPEYYDLVLRVDTLGVDGAVEVLERAVRAGIPEGEGRPERIAEFGRSRGVREIVLDPLPPLSARKLPFAHPSEAEFARILDFYRIRWEYEPESFPVDWWPDGRVKESFTPDFYLPDLGTYLELTTMKQSLVTKKNRKIRRFRELYPDRKLNIFYRRDFKRLAMKYGLE